MKRDAVEPLLHHLNVRPTIKFTMELEKLLASACGTHCCSWSRLISDRAEGALWSSTLVAGSSSPNPLLLSWASCIWHPLPCLWGHWWTVRWHRSWQEPPLPQHVLSPYLWNTWNLWTSLPSQGEITDAMYLESLYEGGIYAWNDEPNLWFVYLWWILDNTDAYRKLRKDPIATQEARIVHILLQLHNNGEITKSIYNRTRPSGSCPPRICRLLLELYYWGIHSMNSCGKVFHWQKFAQAIMM